MKVVCSFSDLMLEESEGFLTHACTEYVIGLGEGKGVKDYSYEVVQLLFLCI